MASLKTLAPHVRLSIRNPKSKNDSEFGRGIAELCLGVREHGSLNAAAKGMGMAYSKAWRIRKRWGSSCSNAMAPMGPRSPSRPMRCSTPTSP